MSGSKAPSLRLSPRKERAASIIANGGTQTEAAEKVGVSKQTLTAWAKDEKFQKRIEELRTDLLKQADEILERGITDAAQTVVDVAGGKGIDLESRAITARLKAALWILERFKKGKTPPAKEGAAEQEAAREAEMMEDDELEELATRGTPDDE